MKLTLSGELENFTTRADGTVKLVIGTQEVDAELGGKLFDLRRKFIKVLLSDTKIEAIEEKMLDELKLHDTTKAKTKSQMLRSVLWLLHKQGGGDQDFNDFYDEKMDKIIQQIKDRLE